MDLVVKVQGVARPNRAQLAAHNLPIAIDWITVEYIRTASRLCRSKATMELIAARDLSNRPLQAPLRLRRGLVVGLHHLPGCRPCHVPRPPQALTWEENEDVEISDLPESTPCFSNPPVPQTVAGPGPRSEAEAQTEPLPRMHPLLSPLAHRLRRALPMMAAALALSRDGPISWQIGSPTLPGQTRGLHAVAMAVDEAICLKTRDLNHDDLCGIRPTPMNGNVIVNASASGTETVTVTETVTTGTAANANASVNGSGIGIENETAAETTKEQPAATADAKSALENTTASEAVEATPSPREKSSDGEAAVARATIPVVGSAASETTEAIWRPAAAMNMKVVSDPRHLWGLLRPRRRLLRRRFPVAVARKTSADGVVDGSVSVSGIVIGDGSVTITVMAVVVVAVVEEVIASADARVRMEEHKVKVVVKEEVVEEECGWEVRANALDGECKHICLLLYYVQYTERVFIHIYSST